MQSTHKFHKDDFVSPDCSTHRSWKYCLQRRRGDCAPLSSKLILFPFEKYKLLDSKRVMGKKETLIK